MVSTDTELRLSKKHIFSFLIHHHLQFLGLLPHLWYWPFSQQDTWDPLHTLPVLILQHPLSNQLLQILAPKAAVCANKWPLWRSTFPGETGAAWNKIWSLSRWSFLFTTCTHFYLCSSQGRATYNEFNLTFSRPQTNSFALLLFPPSQLWLRSYLFSVMPQHSFHFPLITEVFIPLKT